MENTYAALKKEIPPYLLGEIELHLSQKEIVMLLESLEYLHEYVVGLTPAHSSIYKKIQALYDDYVR